MSRRYTVPLSGALAKTITLQKIYRTELHINAPNRTALLDMDWILHEQHPWRCIMNVIKDPIRLWGGVLWQWLRAVAMCPAAVGM